MTSTFSADTKDALAREIPTHPHCRNALRDGLYYYGGENGAAGTEGRFRTQRSSVARLAWSLLDDRKERPIHKAAEKRLQKRPTFEIRHERPRSAKPAARCDRRMELRAAFLVCGSLAAPTHGYHLEFVPPDDVAAERLVQLMRAEGRTPKTARRKRRLVVYFKDIDEITGFLTSIGAFAAVLRLEDVRALKETKNRIRRLVNTDAANVDRSTSAAAKQREAIALVADAYGFRRLSPPLREVAELRLAHPTETLTELGRRCNPQVGKSTVGGRIAALLRLARRLEAAYGAP
jgi:DNA-binding protein WhiA